MPITPEEPSDTASGNKAPYRTSLVRRSHEILKMGYDLIDPPSLADCDEETITGRLTKAMQDALEDLDAPSWTKSFSAEEERPVNDSDREGKHRLRIDIEVIKHTSGPCPRFRFEAKRLRNSTSHRDYLGVDGLGCFLDGRYAAGDPDAGMLGYVQDGTASVYRNSICDALLNEPSRFGVAQGGELNECRIVRGLDTHASLHHRSGGLPSIMVFHTLLTCH